MSLQTQDLTATQVQPHPAFPDDCFVDVFHFSPSISASPRCISSCRLKECRAFHPAIATDVETTMFADVKGVGRFVLGVHRLSTSSINTDP